MPSTVKNTLNEGYRNTVMGFVAFQALRRHTVGRLFNYTLTECESEKKFLLFDCEGRTR